jgi:hypothetical protein
MRYLLTGLLAALVTVLVLTLVANPHALPTPKGKRWSAFTPAQKEKYVRANLAHARGAIDYVRTHRRAYRGLAGVNRLLKQHRRLERKAERNLQGILARKYALNCHAGQCIVNLIRRYWPEDPDGAVTVAWCESNWTTYNITGQYVGVFQLGSGERSRYGHVGTEIYASPSGEYAIQAPAWEQIVAAHNYYLSNGWQPWQCSPSGGLNW